MASSSAHSKSKWTRDQLLQQLQLINGLVAKTHPPTLPPTPPSSPRSGTKRKLDSEDLDLDSAKRQRTSASFPASRQAVRSTTSSATYSRPEDGEVYEDRNAVTPTAAPQTSSIATTFLPQRRPKASKPASAHFLGLYNEWYANGRILKYSGDVRFRSTYAPNHEQYQPLPSPPPLNSPYHKFGGIIAQLEAVEALLCFTYGMWAKDMSSDSCNEDTWKTMDAFLQWCKEKWKPEKANNEAETAFFGLIWQIEAFIRARLMFYNARSLPVGKITSSVLTAVAQAAEQAEKANSSDNLDASCTTPKMLPSPASIGGTSARSTPTSSGTPNPTQTAASSGTASSVSGPPIVLPIPSNFMPSTYQDSYHKTGSVPKNVLDAMASARGVIHPTLAQRVADETNDIKKASEALAVSQKYLTLPVMFRAFPRTFARCVHSSLDSAEEWAPDFRDDDCELSWPGQALNGQGLGWLCLMGKAMVHEFGKPYGYRGLAGAIPKTAPAQTSRPQSHGRSPIPSSSLGLSIR